MLRALLLALALLVPLALAEAPAARGVPPPLLLRADPDGGQTLLLLVEDDPLGPYEYKATQPPGNTELREVGTYLHAWTWNGVPEVTLGAYAVHATQGRVRVPVLVVENAASDSALVAQLQDGLGRGRDMAALAAGFLAEALAPEAYEPTEQGFGGYTTSPTVAVWHARRALPGADLWVGSYLARTGEAQATSGQRTLEAGALARLNGEDTRVAGLQLAQDASAVDGAQRTRAATLTVSARTPAGLVPLATVQGDDARDGPTLRPDHQSTGFAVGVEGPDGFVPLAGVHTSYTNRDHARGTESSRTTAVGAFVDGAFTPLAGLRVHTDRTPLTELATAFVQGGLLGSNRTGDAEVSVGAFPAGEYQPVAQLALDDAFAGQRWAYATMVSAGLVTPAGFARLASASYDGTRPLLDWALGTAAAQERGTAWLVAAGPWAGQLYTPLVGVRFLGEAPQGERAHEAELAVGTFAVGYPGFVPLLAAGASSDEDFPTTAGRMVSYGPGHQSGSWDAGAGTYALGPHVSLAEVGYAPVADPDAPASGDLVVRLAGQPVLRAEYRGEAALAQSFGNPGALGDDRAWRATVGAETPAGFVPLLRLAHDGDGSTVTVGPDL